MGFFTPEQIEDLSRSPARLALLSQFEFRTKTVHVWNGNTELEAGGKTWVPMFGAASIDGLAISTGAQSDQVTFTLSGVPDDRTDLLALALEETPVIAQQLVTVYAQVFDADWQPAGSAIGVWWGYMQAPRVTRTHMQGVEGAVQSISLVAENAFFNRSRPPYGRYTDRDQQQRSPGDKFFQFTPSLIFKSFTYPDY